MLKPDPMRYSRVPTRATGAEWTEPDLAETEPDDGKMPSSELLAFRHEEELSADLALDLRLHEILERGLRATAGNGAVIALASGDKMVCRATSGERTPSTGACLNTRSGLSGLCIQTREMQHCEDANTDPWVNADACRALGIRSIVVLPVADGARLWGILEVFSSRPHAFGETDIKSLQALGRKVSYTVQEAVEGEIVTPEPDGWPVRAKASPEPSETITSEAVARQVLESSLRDPSVRRRDYRTTALTATVIALAVLLGWMVGRAGWSMAVGRGDVPPPPSPEEVQASAQVTARPAPPTVPAKSVEEPAPSAKPASAAAPAVPVVRPDQKSTVPAAEPVGGLVVYEQGKVVFRMPPKPSAPGRDSGPVQTLPTQTIAAAGDSGSASPSATSNVLERVEPQYPEAAREQRMQGPVVLNVLVGVDGEVRELKVVSGNPVLAKAATDAVRQWRFRPHRTNDVPVEFETRITVNFALP